MHARTVRPSALLACAALCAGLFDLGACGGQTAVTGDAGTRSSTGVGGSGGGSGSSASSSGAGSSSGSGSGSSGGSGSSSGVYSTSSSGADSGASICSSIATDAGACNCAANEVCDNGNRCLTVLATGRQYPAGIVVDATNVYWLEASTGASQGGLAANGSVMKCAVAGCNQQPTTLASGQAGPTGITLDATNVYWANGGAPWSNSDGALLRCAVGGCNQSPTVILSLATGPNSIAVDATRLYWTIGGNAAGNVWSCPLAGCAPTKIADTMGNPVGVNVSSTTLMWAASSGTFGGSLWACAPGSCAPTAALVSSTSHAPVTFAMDSTSAYFLTDASLLKCALGGCANAPTSLDPGVDFGVDYPGVVASDGVNVYFTTTPMGPCGAVMKCPVGGCNGQPTIIGAMPGISTPDGLALDATYVYWTDYNLGVVLRALK